MGLRQTRAAPAPGARPRWGRMVGTLAGAAALALLLGACGAASAPAPAAKSTGAAPAAPAAPAAGSAGSAPAAPAPTAAATAPPELRRVRITVPSLSATAIQYYIARDEGFY